MFTAFKAFAAAAAAMAAAGAMTASAMGADLTANAMTPAASDAMVSKIRNYADAQQKDFTQFVLASAETRVMSKIENVGFRKPAPPFQMASNFLPDE